LIAFETRVSNKISKITIAGEAHIGPVHN